LSVVNLKFEGVASGEDGWFRGIKVGTNTPTGVGLSTTGTVNMGKFTMTGSESLTEERHL
jgi:hypothetical protein